MFPSVGWKLKEVAGESCEMTALSVLRSFFIFLFEEVRLTLMRMMLSKPLRIVHCTTVPSDEVEISTSFFSSVPRSRSVHFNDQTTPENVLIENEKCVY